MSIFSGGGVPSPDYDSDDINYVDQKTEFTNDVFVYGKLYADLGGDVQTFSTAGVERVRITKEGDVAIGSKNPNVVVDTSNTSILSVGIVTAREYYGIFKGSIDPAVANDKISEGNSEAEIIDTGTNGHFKVTTEGIERLRITSDGKVGIATDNPATKFHLQDGELTIKSSGESGPYLYRNNGSGPDIVFHSGRGSSFTSPTASGGTDLLGNINFAGYDGSAYQRRASINGVIDGTVSSGSVPTAIYFRTGTTTPIERLRIKSDGKVGINTNNPTAGLQVNNYFRSQLVPATLSQPLGANWATQSAIVTRGDFAGGICLDDNGVAGYSIFTSGNGNTLHIRAGLVGQVPVEKLLIHADNVADGKILSLCQVVFYNVTQTERDALNAQTGGVIYNTTVNKLQCWNGSSWNNLF